MQQKTNKTIEQQKTDSMERTMYLIKSVTDNQFVHQCFNFCILVAFEIIL